MIVRNIAPLLKQLANQYPVVILTGPRQNLSPICKAWLTPTRSQADLS